MDPNVNPSNYLFLNFKGEKMIKPPISVFPKQLDDLLQKLGRTSQAYANELARKLARRSQETIETLIKYQTRKIDDVN